MPSPSHVSVAVPLPLRGVFTYRVPEALHDDLHPGMRVLVPFGRRTLTGVVTGFTEDVPPRVRPIEDVLDAVPLLDASLLELCRWMADYYWCGWGEALRTALPPGTQIASRLRALWVGGDAPDDSDLAALRDVLLRAPDTPLAVLEREGVSRAVVQRAERLGLVRIQARLDQASVKTKQERYVELQPTSHELKGAVQQRIVAHLRDSVAAVSVRSLIEATGAGHGSVRRLVELGVLVESLRQARRDRDESVSGDLSSAPVYHPHQQTAVDAIGGALDKGEFAPFLLHGVTGSGKTEVYLAALEQTLAQGRSGIVLVPEIALTPQTVRRFRNRFGNQVAVLHSRMGAGERFDTWHAIRRGEYRIAVGPRSAVLAPLANIGLIVVDEEHEASYKQFDPAPRYHARDVAVYRARQHDAVCVLGSATPSLESLHNAQDGKYRLLRMPERAPTNQDAPARLPSIRILDLTAERSRTALTTPLRVAISDRLSRSEQIILLQNRRGYSPVLECQSCGWSPECLDCSVTMTLHKASRQIRCHYCGRAHRIPQGCPDCDGKDFVPLGSGTQRVQEELAATFPDARVLRMDLDTTGRKNAHRTILQTFGRGDADILLGTQMVAKGLDFERVTLVGVIDADTGLRFPDFRAEERTFQLLTQVAGRAGRADLKGEVLLQTRNPEHAVFRHVRQHGFDAFAADALATREAFGYPPHGRLVRIQVQAPEEHAALRLAERWAAAFRATGVEAELAGPAPAFVPRVRKSWRCQILVKAARSQGGRRLRRAFDAVEKALSPLPRAARVIVDVDPVGVL